MKATITKMKLTGVFKWRLEQTEKPISKLVDRCTKIIHSVDQKDKRMKRSEQSPRNCGTHMHNRNIRRWEKKGAERIFEEIIQKYFQFWQETQINIAKKPRIHQKKISTKNSTLKHIIMSAESQREREPWKQQERSNLLCIRIHNKETVEFSFYTMEDKRKWIIFLMCRK